MSPAKLSVALTNCHPERIEGPQRQRRSICLVSRNCSGRRPLAQSFEGWRAPSANSHEEHPSEHPIK